MKNNSHTKESIVALVLLIVLWVLLNPFRWWMPDMMLMTLLIGALIVFGLFALFVLQEKTVDERERQNSVGAGRAAFVAGTLALTLGIVFQSITHRVDPWLFAAFVAMVVVKLGSRIYIDRNY